MEELMRFMIARPAQRADAQHRPFAVRPSGEYHRSLADARRTRTAKTSLTQLALRQRADDRGADEFELGTRMLQLESQLRGGDLMLSELNAVVRGVLGKGAEDIVREPSFERARSAASDALVTNALLGEDGPLSSYDAAAVLRTSYVVEAIARHDTSTQAGNTRNADLDRTLMLPGDVFPLRDRLSKFGTAETEDVDGGPGTADGAGDGTAAELGRTITDPVAALRGRRDQLLAAYQALTHVAPEGVVNHVLDGDQATGPLGDAEAFHPRLRPQPVLAANTQPEHDPVVADGGDERPMHGLQVERASRFTNLVGPGMDMDTSVHRTTVFKADALTALPANVRDVLGEHRIDLRRVDLPTAVDRLAIELREVESALASSAGPPSLALVRIGSTFYADRAGTTNERSSSGMSDVARSGIVIGQPVSFTPSTHGSIVPAGIGDLLVVRQSLKRYEALELAHVENVLKGEYKERMHRRALTTVETVTTDVETTRQEERDQQTTERFQLQAEASQVQKEDTSLKLGLAVSGKYGPVVEFKATTDFALNQSKEEANKVATNYGKDVTTRAASRLSERRREERVLQTTEEFEEKNTHGVDNKAGAEHVVGQYQWLDKVYEAQVFNYGKRVLFDLMLPEPAAFLLYATVSAPPVGVELVKPEPFAASPADLNEFNYTTYVQRYGVTGVEPPPPPYVTIGKAFDGKGDQDNGVTKSVEIPIPDGYCALSGHVVCVFSYFNDGKIGQIWVVLGGTGHSFPGGAGPFWSTSLNKETGTVPFGLGTFRATEFAVALEIVCQRIDRAVDDWRLKTHTAILLAYQKQVRDYEEKLAAMQVEAGAQVQGRNPTENERLIRTELKKGAISTFTAQQFDMFGAILESKQGYPQPSLTRAQDQGRYIRFFEQALEWEQMMFLFYPYYWGRKSHWTTRALLQDADPLFEEFIKAGAARIVVSVRPGFEHAVAHFMDTGEIWDGGDLPNISSPLYVSIIEEIKERDKTTGEVAQGDPWDVHIPTTLIKLRSDASLPEWKKDGQGAWVPA